MSYSHSCTSRGATDLWITKSATRLFIRITALDLVEQISYGVLNGRTERYYMIRIVSVVCG